MQWILENIEWVFSGIGVFIFGLFFSLFRSKRNRDKNMSQKAGNKSKNFQIGGDLKINQ